MTCHFDKHEYKAIESRATAEGIPLAIFVRRAVLRSIGAIQTKWTD
jgi:hypothetical protein